MKRHRGQVGGRPTPFWGWQWVLRCVHGALVALVIGTVGAASSISWAQPSDARAPAPTASAPAPASASASAPERAPDNPRAPAAGACVMRAQLKGIVNAAMAGYLRDALDSTRLSNCQALLVVVDTPGGMLDATREIVSAFLAAPVPVIVYVAPSGARAGSAGMFITLAGHVAAMAPASNIGAAHPVVGAGKDPEEAGGKELARKIENDTAALARAIAQKRQRNVEWAESAVLESVSATAREAEQQGVIDLVAASQQELLQRVDGRVVDVEGRRVTLATAGAEVRGVRMTIGQRALNVLGDPNLAYLLLMLGFLGIMIEAYNPGMIVPGAVGGFSLLLAAIGLNALPVSIGAVVLILIAVALLITEIYVVSYGFLTLGGLVALVIGSTLLLDKTDPDFLADASVKVSWMAVAPLALVLAGAASALAWQARRSAKSRSTTGVEGLIGASAEARTAIGPSAGWVFVRGERWRATSDEPIEPGQAVVVMDVSGLQLKVRPLAAGRTREEHGEKT